MSPSTLRTAQDLLPEGILVLGAVVCGGLGAVRPRTGVRVQMGLAGLTLVAAALGSLVYLRGMPVAGYAAYSDGLVVDRYAVLLTPVLCLVGLLTVLSGESIRERIAPNAGEYHALVLSATLGAVLLASAREMIAFYVALELLSVSLYVLVGIVKTDPRGSEAGFKYLVIGAASSATLLYGLAILYGLTGTTVLTEVAASLTRTTPAAALGVALTLAGLAFKLGAVPFHQWVPDVYEGAPAPVAGLIAALSKTAGFAILIRLAVTALPATASTWTAVIAVVAAASMVYGNLAALAQRRMRRLLAYSSIGQAGFILMGVLAWRADRQGIGATLFYLMTYAVTVVGAFAAVAVAEAGGVGETIDDYRGLSRRSPLAAVTLALAMVSFVGVPPLAGFFGKLLVFEAATSAGYSWLLLLGVVMTVVSAGYYLRVVRVVLVDDPADEAPAGLGEGNALRVVLGTALATALLSAVAAEPLLKVAVGATGQLR